MRDYIFCCAIFTLVASAALLAAAEPVRVVSGTAVSNPRQPQAAVDEEGTIYVAFGAENAIFCCRSTDGGKSYEEPVKVGEVEKLALGMRRGPRIAAGREAVVVTAISHESGNLLAWRSTDGGQTWSDPVQVNDSPKDAREGLHAMTMNFKGEAYCVWLDLRNKGTQLFGAASTDGGKTWSENRQIYRSPDGSICECCHPAATFDSGGGLHVMWRNSLEGFRDMYAAHSRDGGKTFTAGTKLGTGNWKLNACPMDGGYLAAASLGKVTAVWRRDQQVFRTDTGERGEQLLGKGEQPWAAATSEGAYIVWLSRRPGDLWLSAPKSGQPLKLAGDATDPVVAVPATGKGPVVVVWEIGRRRDTSIMSQVVSD